MTLPKLLLLVFACCLCAIQASIPEAALGGAVLRGPAPFGLCAVNLTSATTACAPVPIQCEPQFNFSAPFNIWRVDSCHVVAVGHYCSFLPQIFTINVCSNNTVTSVANTPVGGGMWQNAVYNASIVYVAYISGAFTNQVLYLNSTTGAVVGSVPLGLQWEPAATLGMTLDTKKNILHLLWTWTIGVEAGEEETQYFAVDVAGRSVLRSAQLRGQDLMEVTVFQYLEGQEDLLAIGWFAGHEPSVMSFNPTTLTSVKVATLPAVAPPYSVVPFAYLSDWIVFCANTSSQPASAVCVRYSPSTKKHVLSEEAKYNQLIFWGITAA